METSTTSTNTPLPVRAAQYVRMSTEHQQYSPENQLEVVRQYAASHNMEIVQEYSDHGRSGLNIAGREGLNQLMSDVESKRTDFSALLVYDVSRWGRFQDVDESAYYEYVLKRDRKSTRLNSSHANISYAVFCLKKKGQEAIGRVVQRYKSSSGSWTLLSVESIVVRAG